MTSRQLKTQLWTQSTRCENLIRQTVLGYGLDLRCTNTYRMTTCVLFLKEYSVQHLCFDSQKCILLNTAWTLGLFKGTNYHYFFTSIIQTCRNESLQIYYNVLHFLPRFCTNLKQFPLFLAYSSSFFQNKNVSCCHFTAKSIVSATKLRFWWMWRPVVYDQRLFHAHQTIQRPLVSRVNASNWKPSWNNLAVLIRGNFAYAKLRLYRR